MFSALQRLPIALTRAKLSPAIAPALASTFSELCLLVVSLAHSAGHWYLAVPQTHHTFSPLDLPVLLPFPTRQSPRSHMIDSIPGVRTLHKTMASEQPLLASLSQENVPPHLHLRSKTFPDSLTTQKQLMPMCQALPVFYVDSLSISQLQHLLFLFKMRKAEAGT